MKNKRINNLVIAFVILVLITTVFVIHVKNLQAKQKEKEPTVRQIEKYENFVFLGDSITEHYQIENYYGDIPIVKSGVSGYKTKDILGKLDTMVYQYNPTGVFILIGTNDIQYDDPESAKTAIKNIKKIVENIKKNRKNAKIFVQGIYPINPTMNEKAVLDRNNETIQKMNEEIKTYCEKNNISYIDLTSELSDENGYLKEEYTYDGLHPNEEGYVKITEVLLDHIYKMK